MNLLKRIVSAFRTGKRAFYAAAETTRLNSGLRGQQGIGPDRAVLMDGPTIRAKLRSLKRNNALVSCAVRTFTMDVLPTPILIEPDVRRGPERKPGRWINLRWNDPAAYILGEWCKGPCDFTGTASRSASFAEMQRSLTRTLFMDGEMFVLRRRRASAPGLPNLQLEFKTSSQLGRAGMSGVAGVLATAGLGFDARDGIEYDEVGRPVAYWFARGNGGGYSVGANNVERVPAEDVLHIMVPDQPGQQVGDLPMAAALDATHWTGEALKNEQQYQAIMGKVAGTVTGSDGFGATAKTDASGNPYELLEFDDMTILRQSAEGSFEAFDTKRPTAGFIALAETFTRWVSSAFGVSYSKLASDYRGLNYSVCRAQWLADIPYLNWWRTDIVNSQFVEKVYARWFIPQCVADGILSIPGSYTAAELTRHVAKFPRSAYIDPTKDAAADLARMQMGESPQRVFGERGLDWWEEVEAWAEARNFAFSLGVTTLAQFLAPQGIGAVAESKPAKDENFVPDKNEEPDDAEPAKEKKRHAA